MFYENQMCQTQNKKSDNITMFGHKSFENATRKQSVCTGCRARVRVLVLLFVWMEDGSIVRFVRGKKKEGKSIKENND